MERYALGNINLEHEGLLSGCVLVVDDEAISRSLHRAILAKKFDVMTASSGGEALEICRQKMPDLVLLDVNMPGMDGYQFCEELRRTSAIPILFLTANESLEEHLQAYDVGGSDLITKPVSADILLRKVSVAIQQYRTASALSLEKKELERMAMGFLSTASQTGTLLKFITEGVACTEYAELARMLLKATASLGLDCSVMVRHEAGAEVITDHGEATSLETSIFEHAAEMGRIFQFRRKMVVNYSRISIIVSNMPDESVEPERTGVVRDSLAILAESAEALAVNVDGRKEAQKRAEQIQVALSSAETMLKALDEQQRGVRLDTRLLLQELVDSIEKTYSWLSTTQEQETTISGTMAASMEKILRRIGQGDELEEQIQMVLGALNAGRGNNAVELF